MLVRRGAEAGQVQIDQGPPTLSATSAAGSSAPKVKKLAPVRDDDRYDFLYGVYPVLCALRAGKRKCIRLWVQKARGEETLSQKDAEARRQVEKLSREKNLPTIEASRPVLDQLTGDRPHQGLVLKCRRRPPEVLESFPPPSPGALWVFLEGVTDPMNLGSLLRSAAFFGASGVVCERGSARLTAVASKASAGAGELLALYGTNNLAKVMKDAREKGWRVAGAALAGPEDDPAVARPLEAWLPECIAASKAGGGAVLVLGAEGAGLRPAVRQACEALLRIEGGADGLDSLNVGVAAGIAMHAIRGALGAKPAPQVAAT